FRWKGEPTAWLAGRPWGRPGSFLEGPGFDREGNLLCVDIPYGRIFAIAPDGRFDLYAEFDGEPNGLRIHRDGRVFVADHKRGLLTVDPATRHAEVLVDNVDGRALIGPNDLVFTPSGGVYFTDMGHSDLAHPNGRLIHVDPDGRARTVLDGLAAPNGLALNPVGTMLYLAMFRENAIWQMVLKPDGDVSRVSRFIQLSGGLGPDGVLVDEVGNLLVVHFGLGCVWVFSPIGEPLYRIVSCGSRMITNIAFGVDDPSRLFIVDSLGGAILCADLPIRGRPPFSHGET
ncbi:gluconolactonase, partial [Prosthecomicrobium hirschii]|uniref:SMP-30/gluconolactonase/LRE family protein n=1 Tax=Prosthecodimorpha hirschii TaxID=665126 RepID=UPI00112CD308